MPAGTAAVGVRHRDRGALLPGRRRGWSDGAARRVGRGQAAQAARGGGAAFRGRARARPGPGRRQDATGRRAGEADMSKRLLALVAAGAALAPAAAAAATAARAHETSLTSRPLVLILAMAALSLIPFALLMVTSFVRISVVLSILRSAIGTPSVPPTQVLTGLALVLTIAVMAPTAQRMYEAMSPALGVAAAGDVAAAEPLGALGTAADRGNEPLRDVSLTHADPRDRASFLAVTLKMRGDAAARAGITDRDFGVIVPAFVTSELRRAFQIGFLLFVPFLIVDMVVANLLLALGMHMLSPTTVSLPFKLLLFVIADGWTLVIRGLLQSYA